jgi:hypothetical protein
MSYPLNSDIWKPTELTQKTFLPHLAKIDQKDFEISAQL